MICDLKSNIVFKTAKHAPQTRFMCVSKKVFLNLCDLFPVTADNLKQRGLHKRLHYLRAMARLDVGKPYEKRCLKRPRKVTEEIRHLNEHASQDSLLDHHTLKAIDEAAQA